MPGALVLNATYEPLCVVPLRRAVVLVLAEKAVVVESGDGVMRSARASMPVPSVVRLSRYVRVPYRREVPLTRRAVLDRDRHACVYCGSRADTIDHVRPRSRGGNTYGRTWWPPAPGATIARATACSPNSAGTRLALPHGHRQRWLLFWDGRNVTRPGSATLRWTGRVSRRRQPDRSSCQVSSTRSAPKLRCGAESTNSNPTAS